MNNNPNLNQNNFSKAEGVSYTAPCVPKASVIAPTIFAAIFFTAGVFIPLPFSLLLIAAGAILSAKGFSARSSFLPLISPIPAILISIFTNELLVLFALAGGILCAVALFLTLKFGGNKTTVTIVVSCVIIALCLILFIGFMYSEFGGISEDELRAFIDQGRPIFSEFTQAYLDVLDESFNSIPEGHPQKNMQEATTKLMHEMLDDPNPLYESILTFVPGVIVLISNICAYLMTLVYFALVKENTGHAVFTTRQNSYLTISVPGVILFSLGYFFLFFMQFMPLPAVIGLNFVIIYTPPLCVVGARSLLVPELRRRNRILIIAAGVMLFIYPILSFFLLGFMGANAITTQAMMDFINRQTKNKK